MENRSCYLFFAGYYLVSMASRILCGYNIANRIVRAPVYIRNSCNFALLIETRNEEKVLSLLERENIRVEKKAYAAKNV